MSFVKERPEKILIVSCGSRGDIQPYIVLGKELLAAGYEVLVASNENNQTIVEECGVACFGAFANTEKICRENAAVKEAMAQGNTGKYLTGFGQAVQGNAITDASNFKQIMSDFKPDLAIFGNLVYQFCASALFWYEVPAFYVLPNHLPPSPKRMPWGLPDLPFGLNGWLIQNMVLAGMWQGFKKADAMAAEVAGHKITEMVSWQFWLVEEGGDPNVVPRLLALDSKWAEVMYPGIKPSVKCVGSMAFTAAYQEQLASGDVQTNFGYADELERVRAFVAAGSKPIFTGWGSMTCRSPEYMVKLLLTALKLTGYRAIIQAGWANLSLELLKSCAEDKGLVEYAEQNALFIGAAPHEWLFPQCACTVQHGGCGTTSCSLRAGTPTVVTPIFLDQFDSAYMVNELGLGVGFAKKQFQKISARELADAIVKCVSSDDIRAKAAEMSKVMQSYDAAKNVVAYMDDFWANEVQTGRQQRLAQEALQRMKTSHRSTCTCCGF